MHPFLQAHKSEVAPIVRDTLAELHGARRDVLAEYVKTKGQTDWVWLEESLSLYISERLPKAGAVADYLRYLCAFTLAMTAIREEFPLVMGPMWLPEATRAMALEGIQHCLDAKVAGTDEDDVLAFIQDHGVYCDDDDGSASRLGENVYGDMDNLVEDFMAWAARHAINPASPYCKPREQYMRYAALEAIVDNGHPEDVAEAWAATKDVEYWRTAYFNDVYRDFERWLVGQPRVPDGCPSCGRDIDALGGNPDCPLCAAEPSKN